MLRGPPCLHHVSLLPDRLCSDHLSHPSRPESKFQVLMTLPTTSSGQAALRDSRLITYLSPGCLHLDIQWAFQTHHIPDCALHTPPPTDLLPHLDSLTGSPVTHARSIGVIFGSLTSCQLPSPGDSYPSASLHLAGLAPLTEAAAGSLTAFRAWLFHNGPLRALSEAEIGHPLVKAPAGRTKTKHLSMTPKALNGPALAE